MLYRAPTTVNTGGGVTSCEFGLVSARQPTLQQHPDVGGMHLGIMVLMGLVGV
jgi:hypothetical protein